MTMLTPEMLADQRIPADAQISPNGESIAVSVGPFSKQGEHRTAAIWLVDPTRTRSLRQLTSGEVEDTTPRWSPDGSALAFLSDRKERGKKQVYVQSPGEGEARPVTDERGGVTALCWLPGSTTRIACIAADARSDEEQQRRKDGDDTNVYGAFWPFGRLAIVDTGTGETRRFAASDRHVASIAPSPDGRSIAAVIVPTPEIDSRMGPSEIVSVDIESGEVTTIAALHFAPDNLTWTHDGARLYFNGRGGATAVSSQQLWRVDVHGDGTSHLVTKDFECCVSSVTRARDAEDLIVTALAGTETRLYTIHPSTEQPRQIQHFAGDVGAISLTPDGGLVATIASTPDQPDDVYSGVTDANLLRVSDFNPELCRVPVGYQEVVTWHRAGFDLDGILIWPPDKFRTDGPMPTIVAIHGGPYGRWANEYISRWGRWIAQHGYLVFLPNPRGGAGHGNAFAESVLHTVGNDDYLDIMAGLDHIVERGYADSGRLGCGGWSQGGFMTAWIVGHTDRFKAGIMGAGVSDWGMMIATSDIPSYENLMGGGNPYEGTGPHSFDAQSPISYVHNVKTPVLILHGEKDERVPVTQGIFFQRGLKAYDVPVEMVTYPREPHGIQERAHQIDLVKRIRDWYLKWIPTDDAAPIP
jgi:dipeptidyl aminopeptidase/acylaminoacyl peptidase